MYMYQIKASSNTSQYDVLYIITYTCTCIHVHIWHHFIISSEKSDSLKVQPKSGWCRMLIVSCVSSESRRFIVCRHLHSQRIMRESKPASQRRWGGTCRKDLYRPRTNRQLLWLVLCTILEILSTVQTNTQGQITPPIWPPYSLHLTSCILRTRPL